MSVNIWVKNNVCTLHIRNIDNFMKFNLDKLKKEK